MDKSDIALSITQPTTESTLILTQKSTPTPATLQTTVKTTPIWGITPIPVEVKSLPKFRYLKVAIFGTNDGLSDSFKIVAIDNMDRILKVASIERDIICHYDGRDYKMNELYGKLGPVKFLKWFNENFHTDVRDFVSLDFDGFIKVMDLVGSIEVDVSEKDRLETNKLLEGINNNIQVAGLQLLNGHQALAFSRARKGDSDFARSKRQDIVIRAIIKKIMSYGISERAGLIKQLTPFIRTSVPYSEALSLAYNLGTTAYTMNTKIFPSEKEIIFDGMMKNIQGQDKWYLEINKELVINNLNGFLN